MSERFFHWLARKYGWGAEAYNQFDEDFQESLYREYLSICASY